MATPTRKCKYEEVRWSLSRFSLTVRCAGVSAFYFLIVGVLGLIAITTTHCTVHRHAHEHGIRHSMAAWAHATYQYHVNGTGMVGRSVDAHVPVDNASVGLAQAHPNYEGWWLSAGRSLTVEHWCSSQDFNSS